MTFEEVLLYCADQPEFVREFDRLYGAHLSTLDRRSGLDAMIDEATGRDTAALDKFAAFVLEFVWPYLPLSRPPATPGEEGR
jgi:hypothetical protein